MKDKLIAYVKAGYPALYVVSFEEQRVEAELRAIAQATEFTLYAWSITDGIVDMAKGEQLGCQDPIEMLDKFNALPEKSILVARDFHMILADPNPLIVRKVKDALLLAKTQNRVLVILGCQLKLPPELEKEITVVEFGLPGPDELNTVLDGIARSAGIELNGNRDELIRAASGLTTTEAEATFALSCVTLKTLDPKFVAKEKASTLKKNGLLEVVETVVTLDDIGGLEYLKEDLVLKKGLFTKEAKEYGLPTPRPILTVGQPGTGKSLVATACGSIFNVPLLRLEAGKLFGSLVGQSEQNWRTAFSALKAVAPCCCHIDEVDGLFSGAASSGHTDGGTTNRVIKAILQDLQFNSEGIFFVFTANDIDGLPDPLIDRCDTWSVDLPTQEEREAIWKIHIAKRKRNPADYNLAELAAATEGFSGRQIEATWIKAMTWAFSQARREPTEQDAIQYAESTVPTSVTMRDAIDRRRARLKNRAQQASKPKFKPMTVGRKLA